MNMAAWPTVTVHGVDFQPVCWDFLEDGIEGAIYFEVQSGLLRVGSNNGASHWREPRPGKGNVRVATPCMEHGEQLGSMRLVDVLMEAAEMAYINLRPTA